jgi:hypothetical protein
VSRMAGEWTFSGILDQKGCGGQAPTLSCRGKSRAWDLQRHHHKAGWPTLRKRRYWSSP